MSFLPSNAADVVSRVIEESSSSPSASLMSTPLRSSGGGGVNDGSAGEGAASGKTKLFSIGAIVVVCGGVIQTSGGVRFCTQLACNCTIKRHKTNKVVLETHTFHIYVFGKAYQAFTEPVLHKDRIPQDAPGNPVEEQEWSTAGWRSYITACMNHENLSDVMQCIKAVKIEGDASSDESQWVYAEVVEPAEHEKLVAGMKTPGRKIRMPAWDGGDTYSDVPNIIDLFAEVKAEDSLSESSGPGVAALAAHVNTVMEKFKSKAVTKAQYDTGIRGAVIALDDSQQRTGRIMQVMQGMMGSTPEGSDLIPVGSTVWDAISAIHSELEARKLAGGPDDGGAALTALGSRFTEMNSRLTNNWKRLGDRVTLIEQGISAMKGDIRESFAKSFVTFKALMKADAVNESVAAASYGSDPLVMDMLQDLQDRLDSLEDDRTDPPTGEQLEELRIYMGELEKRTSNVRHFAFDGGSLGSLEDVQEVLAQSKDKGLGVYVDIMSLMIIMVTKQLSGKEQADKQYSSTRIDRSSLESELIASVSHEAPGCFFSAKMGGSELTETIDGFGAPMGSYEIWDVGSSCQRIQLTKLLTRKVKALTKLLTTRAPGDRLAKELLDQAEKQVIQLMLFITNFNQDLVNSCHFTPKAAWGLVGRCVRAIFTHLHGIRVELGECETFTSVDEKAEFAHTMIRSTMEMWDIIDNGFRTHPIVMREVQLFTLEHRVDAEQLEAVRALAKEARDLAKVADAKAEKFKAECVLLKQECGNLKAKLNKK